MRMACPACPHFPPPRVRTLASTASPSGPFPTSASRGRGRGRGRDSALREKTSHFPGCERSHCSKRHVELDADNPRHRSLSDSYQISEWYSYSGCEWRKAGFVNGRSDLLPLGAPAERPTFPVELQLQVCIVGSVGWPSGRTCWPTRPTHDYICFKGIG